MEGTTQGLGLVIPYWSESEEQFYVAERRKRDEVLGYSEEDGPGH